MEGIALDIDLLREEIEKLVLLEEVAERRQQMIEKQLDEATQAGISPETIRQTARAVEGLDPGGSWTRRRQTSRSVSASPRRAAENLAQPIG